MYSADCFCIEDVSLNGDAVVYEESQQMYRNFALGSNYKVGNRLS